MEIYVGRTASDPTGLPMYLEIRKPSQALPSYMNIGEPVGALIRMFGKPHEQDDRSITYYTDESEDSVTFAITDGRITSIHWAWYFE